MQEYAPVDTSRAKLYYDFFGEEAENVVLINQEDANLLMWQFPDSVDTSEMPHALKNGKFTEPGIAFETMENFLKTQKANKTKQDKVFKKEDKKKDAEQKAD